MPSPVTFDAVVEPEWSPPLGLLGSTFVEVNPKKTSLKVKLTRPITIKVPTNTKVVQISVSTMDICFGTTGEKKSAPVKSIWYEIINPDYSQVSKGIFKFHFQAILENDAQKEWTGYFILQLMCFG